MNTTDNNIIQFNDTPQTMTSLEIAEVTGKNHFDVLKAIRKIEPAWEKVRKSKFTCSFRISELPNGGKKENPYYVLTKTECLYVATKFNDEARARLVIRWEQLEHQARQAEPQPVVVQQPPVMPALTRRQLLLMSLQAEEECERLREEKRQLEYDKISMALELGRRYEVIQRLSLPTAATTPVTHPRQELPAGAAPATDGTAITYTASQLAALYGMKAISFNNLLQQLGLQHCVGGQWVITADYAGNGYSATKHITVTSSDGTPVRKPFTVWTEAGRQFLQQTLRQKGIMTASEEKALGREAKKGGSHV